MSAYRIIQEALTNVVKHAGGGARAVISLDYGDAALQIRVADNGGLPVVPGRGADAGAGMPPAGHGIIGMRERANLCGGEFTAEPLAAGGFQVTATLPLLPAPASAPASAPVGGGSPAAGGREASDGEASDGEALDGVAAGGGVLAGGGAA
jgi:signal transduction histidine kinase